MQLYTIGFTKKSAEIFFRTLKDSGVRRLVDVRLNNVSQLSGFAKRDDLRYFLQDLCGIEYVHELRLAPNKLLLDNYRRGILSWQEYEVGFLELMAERKIENTLSRESLNDSVFLCSEATAHHCHRRLAAEYLAACWGDTSTTHL